MLHAAEAGYQAALMAPTEILAEQHYLKLADWLPPLGIQVAWLSGSQRKRARSAMQELLASGEAMLAVGTHALIEDPVAFPRLGWRWSTSSTASACASACRCARKVSRAPVRTC